MASDGKFDPQDYAGRILLASPLLAIGIAFGVGAGANWYAEQTGRLIVSPVALAIVALPALVALAGSAAGGFLVRRRLPVRIAATFLGGAFGLGAYIGLALAIDAAASWWLALP